MPEVKQVSTLMRFGHFEVDPQSGELRKQGLKIRLQEQPFQILVMLLEHPGEVVTREELQKKLWQADTFVDFDRGLNRAINRLRDALGDAADSPRFVETIPRRGYRFTAPVEIAGEVASMPPPAGKPTTAALFPRRRLTLISAGTLLAIALLSIGLGVGRIRDRLFSSASQPRIDSLAVLPLENLSSDPAQEYFADGMTDEVITEIARIGSLRVISRTSIMQYKGAHRPLSVIAKELGVDAVLEGTVMRVGQKVRITAQLIRARDDRHLWSEKYERDLSDVLILQGEVAQAIANQIQVRLTPEEHKILGRPRSVNPRAYEAYLEGTFFRNKHTEEGFDKSIECFSRAIALDPTYAQGYAGLSQSYVFLGILGFRPSGEVYLKAKAAALKGLELDESDAEAHLALADVKKGYDWDWKGAEVEYKRGLELNPSYSLAHRFYADYLSKMGRHDEAVAQAGRARQLDPVSSVTRAFLGRTLYRARRYDEALMECQKALELDESDLAGLWFLAAVYEQKREFPKSIALFKKAASISDGPLYRALLGHAYALAGEKAQAFRIVHDLDEVSKQKYVSPLDLALIYTGLGDRDTAFLWLEKAYRQRTMRIQELPDPHFDSLRSDPRFPDLMRRIGLPL